MITLKKPTAESPGPPGGSPGRPEPPRLRLLAALPPPLREGCPAATTLGPRVGAPALALDGRWGAGAAPPPAALAPVLGPWCACLHHGGRAAGPYPHGRTEAARLPGPIAQLWLHVRRWPSLGRLPQAGAPRPALLAAAVPWLTLPGRAMADARWAWPGGTGQHWQEPAVPQWLCGDCPSETLTEDSTATPLEHLPREYSVIYELRRRDILPRPSCLLHRQQPGCGRPPLKKKDFKEERVAKFGLYDIGKSTTLEANKSLLPTWLKQSARSKTPSRGRLPS